LWRSLRASVEQVSGSTLRRFLAYWAENAMLAKVHALLVVMLPLPNASSVGICFMRATVAAPLFFASAVSSPTLRLGEFAHQMRDLLTIVVGSLEQLRRQSLDEHGCHQLTRAEVGALRAADLLNRYAPLSDPGRQDGHNAKELQ
jgi:hypothetical protein